MNKIFVAFVSLFYLPFGLFAQVEIPEGNHPYHRVVEWKGVGALFINSDPAERSRDYNLTFVNKGAEIQWQETIYPKTHNPKIIASSASKYIYFFDQLAIEKSQLNYHQVSRAGSVKSTSISFQSDLRKMGFYNPDDFEVVNIINTPSALFVQLRLENKKEDRWENVLFSITHHNHRVYANHLPPTTFDKLKEELESFVYFAGNDENTIYLAKYQKMAKRHTIAFMPFSSKADEKNPFNLQLENYQPLSTTIKYTSLMGANYQEEIDYFSEFGGVGLFQNNNYYYLENNEDKLKLTVFRRDDEGNTITLFSSNQTPKSKRRMTSQLHLIHTGNNWYVESIIENEKALIQLMDEDVEQYEEFSIKDYNRFIENISLIRYPQKTDNFVLPVEDGVLVFDKNTLGSKDGLKMTKK